ncbi:hypothetical protein V8D89_008610 [Ganoderma adspersum]
MLAPSHASLASLATLHSTCTPGRRLQERRVNLRGLSAEGSTQASTATTSSDSPPAVFTPLSAASYRRRTPPCTIWPPREVAPSAAQSFCSSELPSGSDVGTISSIILRRCFSDMLKPVSVFSRWGWDSETSAPGEPVDELRPMMERAPSTNGSRTADGRSESTLNIPFGYAHRLHTVIAVLGGGPTSDMVYNLHLMMEMGF